MNWISILIAFLVVGTVTSSMAWALSANGEGISPINPRDGTSDPRIDPESLVTSDDSAAHTAIAAVNIPSNPATGLLTSANAPLIGLVLLVVVGLYLSFH